MKKIATVSVLAIAMAGGLAGCVVAPVGPYGPAVYAGPAYPVPAPGYVWVRHSYHGWGWHHPRYGWHRGWR